MIDVDFLTHFQLSLCFHSLFLIDPTGFSIPSSPPSKATALTEDLQHYRRLQRQLTSELAAITEDYINEASEVNHVQMEKDMLMDNLDSTSRFMSALSFLELLDNKNKYVELLPVTPVFKHRKNKDDVAGYYSDIIIHIDGKKHVKELLDLRGSTWAYSTEESLSGYKVVLKTLKEHGENSTFFGNTLQSGSHLQSIQMVLTKQAEAAGVDSNTLAYNKRYLQDQGKDVVVLDSIGPLPPYPIVVNSRMDGELKETIVRALKSFDKSEIWRTKFAQYGVQKFVTNHVDSYDMLRSVTEYIKDLNHAIRYY